MTVLAEASKYFIIGKESLPSYNFSVTWYNFHQKAYIKHTRIMMKCLVCSLKVICISAFPSWDFFLIECKMIQSLFWAPQFKTAMGTVV